MLQINIEGVLGWLILSSPFLLLATLIAIVIARVLQKRQRDLSTGDGGAGQDAIGGGASEPTIFADLNIEKRSKRSAVVAPVEMTPSGVNVSQAANYNVYLQQLQQTVIEAIKAEDKPAHATARLALGDLAQQVDDMTTACEHWQIARDLLHELGDEDRCKAVEEKMIENGCPTHWVLNDF